MTTLHNIFVYITIIIAGCPAATVFTIPAKACRERNLSRSTLQPKQRKSLPTTFPTVGSALPRQRISCCSTSSRKDRRKGKTFRKSLCLTTASRDGVPVHSSISTTWQPECSNALPTGTLRLPSTIFPTTAAICSSLVANGS